MSKMAGFDALPRPVRSALAGARFDWCCTIWLRRFETGRITAEQLATWIERRDAQRAQHAEATR